MEEKPRARREQSIVGLAILAALLGFGFGAVAGGIWSNTEVHTTQSGYVLRGDHRAMMVIGDAIFDGLATAAVAAICTVVYLLIRRSRRRTIVQGRDT